MSTDPDIERRVAAYLVERAAYHEQIAARWKRLRTLLFPPAAVFDDGGAERQDSIMVRPGQLPGRG